MTFLPSLNSNLLIQLSVIIFSAFLGIILTKLVKNKIKKNLKFIFTTSFLFYFAFSVFLFVSNVFLKYLLHYSTDFIRIVLIILYAQIFSSFFSSFIKTTTSKITVYIFFWTISFLHIFGFLFPLLGFLAKVKLQIGPTSLTVLAIFKALGVSSILIWTGSLFSNYLEKKMANQKHFQPYVKIIFIKLVKIILISFSIYLGLSLLGIDLSMFSFFAGAIGVGIAFGLQNILSNFFCGFILLMDRSIKPGDVISLSEGKIYGVVNKLNARYVSIKTREGKEHLVPNQDIVTNKIENWSYSDSLVKIYVPFKISLHSDLLEVEKLLLDIAYSTTRVLTKPVPSVRFVSMQENAVDLKLYFWIADPQNGVSSIRSEIIFKAWKAFKEKNIFLPFPPLEVHGNFPHADTHEI